MTQNSLPWSGTATGDCGPYTDSQWAELYRALLGVRVSHSASLTSVKAGVLDGGLLVSLLPVQRGAGANMSVDVPAGTALVNGRLYISDATENLTIDAADPSLTRYDMVVLRSDTATQTIRLAVLKGTPAGSPTEPVPDTSGAPYYEIPLGIIVVAAGVTTITNANIRERRVVIGPPHRIMMDVISRDAGTMLPGQVVTWFPATDFAVIRTTTANSTAVAGVVCEVVAPWYTTRICTHGLMRLSVTGTVNAGDPLSTSTTSGLAYAGTSNYFARALTAKDTSNMVWAYVNTQAVYTAAVAAPNAAQVVREAGYSTTSNTFVNIDATNLSLSVTTVSGSALEVGFSIHVYGPGTYGGFDISIDGTRISTTLGLSGTWGMALTSLPSTNIQHISLQPVRVAVSAGAHTVRLMWKSDGTATMTCGSNFAITLFAREIKWFGG